MPEVVGQNVDGTWKIRRDDGVEVSTAFLPRGMSAPAPAPAPPVQATPEDLAEVAQLEASVTPPSPRVAPPTPEATVSAWAQNARAPAPQMTELSVRKVGESPMGFERPAPQGLEFTGARGDPAVVQRSADGRGWENGGPAGVSGHGPVGAPARSDIGGAPPLRAPPVSGDSPAELTPKDFVTAKPPGAPAETSSSFVAQFGFRPAAPSVSRRALDDAYKQQAEAIANRAAHEQQKAAEEAARLEALDAAERAREAQDSERQALVASKVEDARTQLAGMVKDLEEPSGQIDPSRWWGTRTTGQKIAAFAHAFLAGFGGTTNMVNQYIQQDIDVQRDALDRKERARGGRVEGGKLMLQVARERFGDTILAQNAAKSAGVERAMRLVDIAAAGARSREALVKRDEMKAELAKEKAQADAAFAARAQQLALEQAELELKRRAAATTAQQATAGMAAYSGQAVPLNSLTPEQRKLAVPTSNGYAVLALDEKSATKMRDLAAAESQSNDLLSRMIALRREYGGETLNREAVAEGRALRSSLLLQIKNLEETGALDQGTVEIVGPMIPADPLEWGFGSLKAMETAQATIRGKYANSYRKYIGYDLPRISGSTKEGR